MFHSEKKPPFSDYVVYALKTNSSEGDERKSGQRATSKFLSPSCFVSFIQPQKLCSGFCSTISNTRNVWKYRPLWKDDCLVPLGFWGGFLTFFETIMWTKESFCVPRLTCPLSKQKWKILAHSTLIEIELNLPEFCLWMALFIQLWTVLKHDNVGRKISRHWIIQLTSVFLKHPHHKIKSIKFSKNIECL